MAKEPEEHGYQPMDKLEKKPFSSALQQKKEELYSKVPLSLNAVNVILWVAVAALTVVIILITLEATGVFKINF